MEDSSSNDDEVKESPLSPKLGGKKFKLNDGSSQDSLKEAVASSSKDEKDENVDSGVSADKSESTSSDDRAAAGEGPSNEVVNIAPSSSVRAILLNIRRPKRARNYRKRKSPDSDSNNSSMDSDDLSPPEESILATIRQEEASSDCESEDVQGFISTFSDPSQSGSSDSSASDNSDDSDSSIHMESVGITDSEDDVFFSRPNRDSESEERANPPSVLLKTRPKHDYIMLKEIIHREMGLTYPSGKTSKSDLEFEQKFYGSLHAVYRMDKLYQLNQHKGCVNSINFHPEGHLLASGSDDTNVVVWDWARKKALQTIKTGHRSNVFQSKFLHLNAKSQLNIVTCARDGQVRLLQCPPAGGASSRRRLASHARAAHKLHVSAHEPHVVVSAGEDGLVMQCDVRADHVTRLFHVKEKGNTVPLYSVNGHPLDPRELLVAGRDKFIRVYDRRKSTKPLAMYCPAFFSDQPNNSKTKLRLSMMHLTCAVYNHDGTEILGSYNDEDIYLFDAKTDVYDKDNTSDVKEGYQQRYSGHRNSATFKGVAFFGPKSQYVVSGSDCSYIYIWHKQTGAIVQWMQGDVNGVVNCIEAHPRFPVLATSGLDKDVKIWTPRSDSDPDFDGMERVIRENSASTLRSPLFNDFLPMLYSARHAGDPRLPRDPPASFGGDIEFDGNVCTAF